MLKQLIINDMNFCFQKNGTDIFFSISLEKHYLKPTRGEEGKKKKKKLVRGPGMEKTTMVSF